LSFVTLSRITTSANKTVTCLNSAWVLCSVMGAPQPSQNRPP
jgi:hypothetical protein